ncbi:MAG: NUDIX domain-containing protein [Rikenellaceae bacterium]
MNVEINHSLSVDCAIFGYDDEGLKVLLVEYKGCAESLGNQSRMKLPGSMIWANETIQDAARRVLRDKIGIDRLYLKQTDIFSEPQRVTGIDLDLVMSMHNIISTRVITVGYYALVRITPTILRSTRAKGARWYHYDDVPRLAMDHNAILRNSLAALREDFEISPIAFELLPKRFTIRQMQNLYSAVMGFDLDSRNFRKRVLNADIVKPTGEKEVGVAHKPAEYFMFNSSAYRKGLKRALRYL